eukprot:352675-Chlamydomonas_euryale.AAC.3
MLFARRGFGALEALGLREVAGARGPFGHGGDVRASFLEGRCLPHMRAWFHADLEGRGKGTFIAGKFGSALQSGPAGYPELAWVAVHASECRPPEPPPSPATTCPAPTTLCNHPPCTYHSLRLLLCSSDLQPMAWTHEGTPMAGGAGGTSGAARADWSGGGGSRRRDHICGGGGGDDNGSGAETRAVQTMHAAAAAVKHGLLSPNTAAAAKSLRALPLPDALAVVAAVLQDAAVAAAAAAAAEGRHDGDAATGSTGAGAAALLARAIGDVGLFARHCARHAAGGGGSGGMT